MNAIPEDRLKLLKSSPLYMGEINGPGQPTLRDLQRMEKNIDLQRIQTNSVGTCKVPFVVYEPLILPKDNNGIGDCTWECIKKQFVGTGEVRNISMMVGSGLFPKQFVKVPWDKKSSRFTTPLSVLELKDQRFKIEFKKRRFTPTFTMFKTKKPVLTKTLLRYVGRWIPVLGWILLASDVYQISFCIRDCMNGSPDNNEDSLLS